MEYESYPMSNFINGHRSHPQNGTLDEHIDALTVQMSTTRAQRIRAAIFPEAFDDDASNGYSSSPTQFGHGSAVQKLSEPSQLLKNAVIDIINYKEDAEITEKALPELIRLLNDDDPIVAGQAALILHSLAKKEASRSALSTAPMMNALIQAISKPRASDETRRGVAGVLHCLSQHKQGLLVLYKGGGIPLLVKLLDSPTDSVVNYALSTLHNLLLNVDQSKLEILRCGGCQKMVGLLSSQNAKFLAMLTDCLHILAFNNEEVKIIIESSDGPQQLLCLLDVTDYEKLLWTTTRLLRVLSVSPSIKIVMVSKNAIKLLEKELYEPRSLRIQQNCLQILRNLSDQAVKLENLDSLLRVLIQFLQSTDFITVSCSVGIISNLTCNNQYNKMAVVQYNGVHALVNTIVQFHDQEEIVEPTICALRHITCRHSHASEAQDAVRNVNGLVPIVELLDPSVYSWPIVKSTISLIRNLALSTNNLPILRETGAIQKLAQLLVRSHQELQKQQANHGQLMDNYVRMEDILEACVSALHIIAKDQHNRMAIRDLDCIPLFVRLLHSPSSVAIQRAAVGVLCELANDRPCANIIEQQNCTQKLTDLLKSNDEGVATYAAAILFRLSDDKPNEMKKRLSQDVTSALYRDEHYSMANGSNYSNPYQATPPPAHDAPTMNYYASEGPAGSGLGDRDTMQTSAHHPNAKMGAWFDSDL